MSQVLNEFKIAEIVFTIWKSCKHFNNFFVLHTRETVFKFRKYIVKATKQNRRKTFKNMVKRYDNFYEKIFYNIFVIFCTSWSYITDPESKIN